MNEYGTLYELDGRYVLRFERFFNLNPGDVFDYIINPYFFSQWYPFATGEMDLRTGGKIVFDDGEGTTYEGIITKMQKPDNFSFSEVDDLINISLSDKDKGSRMIFTHTFDNNLWAVQTAAGWHRCLDVFSQIVKDEQIEWHDNSKELQKIYRETLDIIQ